MTGRKRNWEGIIPYQFKTSRPESCTARLQVRVPPSVLERLQKIPHWQERVREALEELISKY